MKKIITILFALLLVFSLCACQKEEEIINNDPEPGIVGGWTVNGSYVKPNVFNDVIEFVENNATISDNPISVVSVLGTQVVAGTNYLLLGEYTVDKASEKYALVTLKVYKDLQGNISIINCKDFKLEDYVNKDASLEHEDLVGAFECYVDEDAVIDAEPLTKALKEFTGANYEATVLLGSQVVSGKNYAYLTYGNYVVPNAEKFLAVVTVYEDVQGNCTISSVAELDLAALAE